MWVLLSRYVRISVVRCWLRQLRCEPPRRQRLNQVVEAVEAIKEYLTKGELTEGLVYDTVRARLIEVGEAAKGYARRPRLGAGNCPGPGSCRRTLPRWPSIASPSTRSAWAGFPPFVTRGSRWAW